MTSAVWRNVTSSCLWWRPHDAVHWTIGLLQRNAYARNSSLSSEFWFWQKIDCSKRVTRRAFRDRKRPPTPCQFFFVVFASPAGITKHSVWRSFSLSGNAKESENPIVDPDADPDHHQFLITSEIQLQSVSSWILDSGSPPLYKRWENLSRRGPVRLWHRRQSATRINTTSEPASIYRPRGCHNTIILTWSLNASSQQFANVHSRWVRRDNASVYIDWNANHQSSACLDVKVADNRTNATHRDRHQPDVLCLHDSVGIVAVYYQH